MNLTKNLKMDNIEEYLNKHLVKDFGDCKQYDTVKACILASIDGSKTWYDDKIPLSCGEYFKMGLPAKEYYKKYAGLEGFEGIGFLPPQDKPT